MREDFDRGQRREAVQTRMPATIFPTKGQLGHILSFHIQLMCASLSAVDLAERLKDTHASLYEISKFVCVFLAII
jgi:hypothetical protein